VYSSAGAESARQKAKIRDPIIVIFVFIYDFLHMHVSVIKEVVSHPLSVSSDRASHPLSVASHQLSVSSDSESQQNSFISCQPLKNHRSSVIKAVTGH
jgi:hypothetical protein